MLWAMRMGMDLNVQMKKAAEISAAFRPFDLFRFV
jgi:hypothetical protein